MIVIFEPEIIYVSGINVRHVNEMIAVTLHINSELRCVTHRTYAVAKETILLHALGYSHVRYR